MIKKRILIIVYALLLCVTASFAWLSNFQANYVSDIAVDFKDGALKVVDLDFDAYIEVPNESGEFERIEGAFTFDKKQMIPDAVTPFKIKIKNNSATAERKAKLGLAIRIDPEQAKTVNILDVMYIDIVAGQGFGRANNYHVFTRLGDADVVGTEGSGEYSIYLYGDGSEIIIPPTTAENEYVTLDCSFYFDQNATAEYQNKVIEAISFRLE